MPIKKSDFIRKASELSALYTQNLQEAKNQLKNTTDFIDAVGIFNFVPLARVIRGALDSDWDMLSPNASGRLTTQQRDALRRAGYEQIKDGDERFEACWDAYNRSLKSIKVDGPSKGTPSPRAVRTFFVFPVSALDDALSPTEFADLPLGMEGTAKQVTRNIRERSMRAREECERFYRDKSGGLLLCLACEIDFGATYGSHGDGYMHFHHLAPLSKAAGAREVSGAVDLVPLCPNCHAMVHRGRTLLTVDELRRLISKSKY